MFEEETQRKYYCRIIKAFTKKFPNIVRYQQIIEKNLADIEKDSKLTQKIDNYFSIIKVFLMSKNSSINNLVVSEEFEDISHKIYDYVMKKFYENDSQESLTLWIVKYLINVNYRVKTLYTK